MKNDVKGLSPAQRAALEERLRTRQRELRDEVARQMRTQDDPRVVGLRNRMEDTDDWAVADAMAAMDIAEVSRDLTELADVEAALARVADGLYGECADCGEPIPYARLAVWPAAQRCIACQARAEAAQQARR